MELTYEQHVELLKLANYFTKLKKSVEEKGIDLDSFSDEHQHDTYVTYVNTPEKKEGSQQKKSEKVTLGKQGLN